MSDSHTFRCSAAGRWLARSLAAIWVCALLLVVQRLPVLPGAIRFGLYFKGFLVLFGWIGAFVLVRRGAELRYSVRLTPEEIVFEDGRRSSALPLDAIVSMTYAPALSSRRHGLPALVLHDTDDREWRVSALIGRGDELLCELLERTERDDLRAWSEALNLPRIMARASMRVAVGYLVGLVVLSAALVFRLR